MSNYGLSRSSARMHIVAGEARSGTRAKAVCHVMVDVTERIVPEPMPRTAPIGVCKPCAARYLRVTGLVVGIQRRSA